MNIKLKYQLSESWNKPILDIDLSAIDENELRYSLFMGDIIFEVANANFSARWGWIPLIDFALSMNYIFDELEKGSLFSEFCFTESNEVIYFKKQNNLVEVSASYSPDSIFVPFKDLKEKLTVFSISLFQEISSTNPKLSINKVFNEWATRIR